MVNVGDCIIYSAHGVCVIDDICKKNFGGETKDYYVLHPKVAMLDLIHRGQAEEIIKVSAGRA